MTKLDKRILPLVALAATGAMAGCSKADDAQGAAATVDRPQVEQKADKKPEKKGDGAKSARAKSGAALGDETLAYPDDLQMNMLAYRLTDRTPPLDEWAADATEVQRANEFERANVIAKEKARLASVYDSTENVGFLQIRMRSGLSRYDAGKGGYYLDAFSPGRQVTFGGREPLTLQLDNLASAFFWPLDPATAQEVLNETNRSVSVDITVRLTGTQRRASGLTLLGTITRYGIYNAHYKDERLFEEFALE